MIAPGLVIVSRETYSTSRIQISANKYKPIKMSLINFQTMPTISFSMFVNMISTKWKTLEKSFT